MTYTEQYIAWLQYIGIARIIHLEIECLNEFIPFAICTDQFDLSCMHNVAK